MKLMAQKPSLNTRADYLIADASSLQLLTINPTYFFGLALGGEMSAKVHGSDVPAIGIHMGCGCGAGDEEVVSDHRDGLCRGGAQVRKVIFILMLSS